MNTSKFKVGDLVRIKSVNWSQGPKAFGIVEAVMLNPYQKLYLGDLIPQSTEPLPGNAAYMVSDFVSTSFQNGYLAAKSLHKKRLWAFMEYDLILIDVVPDIHQKVVDILDV